MNRSWIQCGLAVFFGLVLLMADDAGFGSQEMNRVESVHAETKGDAVLLALSGRIVPLFSSYQLENPRRLVIDFAHTSFNPAGLEAFPKVHTKLVRRLELVNQTQNNVPMLRMLFYLGEPADFDVQADEQGVRILLQPFAVSPLALADSLKTDDFNQPAQEPPLDVSQGWEAPPVEPGVSSQESQELAVKNPSGEGETETVALLDKASTQAENENNAQVDELFQTTAIETADADTTMFDVVNDEKGARLELASKPKERQTQEDQAQTSTRVEQGGAVSVSQPLIPKPVVLEPITSVDIPHAVQTPTQAPVLAKAEPKEPAVRVEEEPTVKPSAAVPLRVAMAPQGPPAMTRPVSSPEKTERARPKESPSAKPEILAQTSAEKHLEPSKSEDQGVDFGALFQAERTKSETPKAPTQAKQERLAAKETKPSYTVPTIVGPPKPSANKTPVNAPVAETEPTESIAKRDDSRVTSAQPVSVPVAPRETLASKEPGKPLEETSPKASRRNPTASMSLDDVMARKFSGGQTTVSNLRREDSRKERASESVNRKPSSGYVSPVYAMLQGKNRRIDDTRTQQSRTAESPVYRTSRPSQTQPTVQKEHSRQASPHPAFTAQPTQSKKTLRPTPSGPAATLRMVGFRLLPQAARISLTLSSDVGIGYEWTDPQTVVFHFKPALITNRLLLYPLQTEAFQTSVVRVVPDWSPRSKEVTLTVRLRKATPFRLLTEGKTYHLDFKK